MRYPSFIEKGNTIGFVAPSFGCAGEPYYSAFQNSLKKWNALGFKTELGFNCYASDGVGISSSPKKCAAEFMEYYKKCDRRNFIPRYEYRSILEDKDGDVKKLS